MVALMKERHTVVDPTLATFSQTLLTRPGKACPADVPWIDHMPSVIGRSRRSAPLDVTPDQFPGYESGWKKLQDALLVLYRNGVPLVPGTDDVAGMVLHGELEAWVEAGIPPSAVLRMATLGGARFLGLDHDLGTVARGKLADLYLVDGDPTREIGAIRRGRLVVKEDAVYYPDEIHEALGITPFAPHAVLRTPSSR